MFHNYFVTVMRLSWAATLCAILRNDSCSVVHNVFLGRNYSLSFWIFPVTDNR